MVALSVYRKDLNYPPTAVGGIPNVIVYFNPANGSWRIVQVLSIQTNKRHSNTAHGSGRIVQVHTVYLVHRFGGAEELGLGTVRHEQRLLVK